MSRYQMLNNVDHANLCINTDRSPELGDNLWYVPTFPAEFRNLQRCYPIVFSKSDDSNQMQAVALLGFEAGENLFVDDQGWHAPYIPLNILRQPFLIGRQQNLQGSTDSEELVVSVDMESPRLSEEGSPVFLEHGGNTEYLEQVNSILQVINQGSQRNAAFADMLLGMDLLESFVLEVQLDDGSDHRLAGFYTIKEDALRELTGDDLVILNNNGFLEPIYMVIASMSNLPSLIELRNARQRKLVSDG